MANPNSRDTLIDYCKRRLGEPVIEVNVDEDQVEDRVDEALQYYQEYHSDATVRTYLKHRIINNFLNIYHNNNFKHLDTVISPYSSKILSKIIIYRNL